MDEVWFNCTVDFNRGHNDRSFRYFKVNALTKIQAIKLLLEYMLDNNFILVNLSGISLQEIGEIPPVVEVVD